MQDFVNYKKYKKNIGPYGCSVFTEKPWNPLVLNLNSSIIEDLNQNRINYQELLQSIDNETFKVINKYYCFGSSWEGFPSNVVLCNIKPFCKYQPPLSRLLNDSKVYAGAESGSHQVSVRHCSLCGAPSVNKLSCPFNSTSTNLRAKNKHRYKHNPKPL